MMSKQLSLAPAIELLEQAYEKALGIFPEDAAAALRDNRPIITIQTNGRRANVLGWHSSKRWKHQEDKLDEITLSAEELGRGLHDVMTTLVHEMVHHANSHLGVSDISSNGYHNKKFKDLAELVGLEVTRSNRGYAHTAPTEEFKTEVNRWRLRNKKALDVFRVRPKKRGSVGSKLKKYTCGCGYGIRIAVDPDRVDLTCGICGERVEIQE